MNHATTASTASASTASATTAGTATASTASEEAEEVSCAACAKASDDIDESDKLLWSCISHTIQNPLIFEKICAFSTLRAVTATTAATKAAYAAAKAEAGMKEIAMAYATFEKAEEAFNVAKTYAVRTAANACDASYDALAAFSISGSDDIRDHTTMALEAFNNATEASADTVLFAKEYDEVLIAVAEAKRNLATTVAKAKKNAQKAYEATTIYQKIVRGW